MKRKFSELFTGPVVWREPVGLYNFVGWLAAVAWPAIVLTLIFLPPTREAGGILNDWRLKALIAAAIAVPAIMYLIRGEREREGGPSSRLGIMARFLLFGFIFSLAALILVVLGFSVVSAFGNEGFLSALGGIESTLFLFGVAGLPVALMMGVSYALWAGLMVALISFSAPQPRVPPSRVSAMFGGPPDEPAPPMDAPLVEPAPEPHPDLPEAKPDEH